MPKVLINTLLLSCILINACNSGEQQKDIIIEGKNYVEQAQTGMSKDNLITYIGKPDSIVDLGHVTDENNYTRHLEIYFYGSNQSVTLINDTVNAIDYNIKQTEARIKHKMDSAKAVQ
jgi:hypothetical protein